VTCHAGQRGAASEWRHEADQPETGPPHPSKVLGSAREARLKQSHDAAVMRRARATVARAKEQKRLKAVAALAAFKAIVAVREAYWQQDKVEASELERARWYAARALILDELQKIVEGRRPTSIRSEIARLCAEHDRLMAEAHEPVARPPVQKSDGECLAYRMCENDAPALTAAPPNAELLTDAQVDALAEVLVHERKLTRAERDAVIAPLTREIAELRDQVSALLTLLGQRGGDRHQNGEVIDHPKNFWRSDVA
jgi:hypothetical protein